MESAELFRLLGDNLLVLSLSAMRVSVAFLLMPLFSKEGVPAMVRNSMFLSMALLSVLLQPSAQFDQFSTTMWIGLFAKEALIGTIKCVLSVNVDQVDNHHSPDHYSSAISGRNSG